MKSNVPWILLTALVASGAVAASATVEPAVRCHIELDREVLPAGAPQTAVVKVTLDPPEAPRDTDRPPVNLALVLDRSGSMSGSKIEKAREAAIEAIRRLGDRDLFSIVIYDHEVETLVPAQSAKFTEAVESRIRGIQSRGNTALFGGVSQGAAEIRKHLNGDYVNRIILLSDGLANVGPSAPADLARLGAALLKEGISVTTVGVGNDFNEDLMTQLAQNSDGNHYFVEASQDLPRIFAQELGDVLSVVARKVVVEIECPGEARPVRIIGREGRIRGNTVELHMNQLYGGQQKYALVELELPAGAPDQAMDIARARCSYENAVSNQSEDVTVLARARFSAELEEVRQSVNYDVNRDLLANEIAVTRDEALDLFNAGRNDAAAQLLREKGEQLQAENTFRGLDGLAQDAQVLEQDAVQFEQPQMAPAAKKAYRASSFNVKTQQKEY